MLTYEFDYEVDGDINDFRSVTYECHRLRSQACLRFAQKNPPKWRFAATYCPGLNTLVTVARGREAPLRDRLPTHYLLLLFLEYAETGCHNNDTERDLRRTVKGKLNYLFAGSPRGATVAAVYYSLIGTCLLQGIDPRRYVVEILGLLDEPATRLTPHAVRERWLANP